MLYITFLWLITTGGLDLLVSFYLFHSSLSPLGNSSLSSIPLSLFSFLFFFSPFIYLFLLYNIVLVLPYINMNPPQVNTCSQSWTPLPHPSPSHPSGSSQCTSPKLPVSCIEPGLAIHIYMILYQSILKEISPGISLEGMMLQLKLQYFGHLMQRVWLIGKVSEAGRDWGQEEKGTTEDEMAEWHHWLNGCESE